MKKKKDKEFYKILKKTWADPKGKALIKLALWMIIFFIIIIICRVSLNNTKTIKAETQTYSQILETFKQEKNYEFIDTEKFNDITVITTGKRYENSYIYVRNKITYYKTNKLYNINTNKETKLLITNLNKDLLLNLIENAEYIKGEGYMEYEIPVINFTNLYDPSHMKSSTENINIKVYYDQTITKIELDLTNYEKLIQTTNNYTITIDYLNIGNVEDFTLAYNQMIGGKQ